MVLKENPSFSQDYLDPSKRSITNQLTLHLKDQSSMGPITLEYPIGHVRRREEGIPLLFDKFENSLLEQFSPEKAKHLLELFKHPHSILSKSVDDLMSLFSNP